MILRLYYKFYKIEVEENRIEEQYIIKSKIKSRIKLKNIISKLNILLIYNV